MIVLLIILILVFGVGGWQLGGPFTYGGGGLSLILVIILIVLLLRGHL